MSYNEEISGAPHTGAHGESVGYSDKKDAYNLDNEYDVKAAGNFEQDVSVLPADEKAQAAHDLDVVGDELEALEAKMGQMSMERTINIIRQLIEIHQHDQNFPAPILERMQQFMSTADIHENPVKHEDIIREMKLEAILATDNSPYLEVRANVDPTDDPSLPCWTFRVWILGSIFSGAGCFIDTLFGYRNPSVYVGTNVAQLLAYPLGKAMAKLPNWSFHIRGRKFSINPGPFNHKEHMLITIMAQVALQAPYTNYIVPAQALPQYFNEAFAYKRSYQFLNTIGTNFVGFGMAGLTRRFLVWPSVAVWPSALFTIALNKAFHTEVNEPVRGPFNRTYTASRQKVFLLAFTAMFVWYFFPGFIFQALSVFSWMTWIAPNNATLDSVTGFFGGVGLNPWPTFDWNNLTVWITPLTVPSFSIFNQGVGILVGAIMTLIFYYKNAWNTGYLPINGNSAYDNTGAVYNVSMILNDDGDFDLAKYQAYSEPWMGAGFVASYLWYFAMYSATATYIIMYHRHEVRIGFWGMVKSAKRTFRRGGNEEEDDDLSEDIHYRLMAAYPEVPEWQYFIILLIAMMFGMLGVGLFPVHTSPVVVIFGIIFTLIVMIPCGLIQAVTGVPVPLNVLAEFIGGSFVEGNANALMYFKTYGYISAYQAILFSNDLKLAHYIKIPPRDTFWAQLWATSIYCCVSSAVFNFALGFKDVCTPDAAFRFTCPNQRTFFTAAVFWGTISPKRLFGPGCRYNWMLIGFPLGAIIVLVHWALRKKFPRNELLRQTHPVMLTAGPATWGSPYNMSYFIGNVYVAWVSFQFLRKRYTQFWAKYNYVVASAFPAGIAIAALVIFFGLAIPDVSITWWGNTVTGLGCEGEGGCPRLMLDEGAFFGKAPGTNSFS